MTDWPFYFLQPTDFRKDLEDGVAKLKASSQSGPESDRLYRQFKEAIWVRSLTFTVSPFQGKDLEKHINQRLV